MNLISSMLIDSRDKNKRPRQECNKTYVCGEGFANF